jgi:uncharacterized protein YjbI with pentapeptide repeats
MKMANDRHLQLIQNGTKFLNLWREANPDLVLDLCDANLRRLDLTHANLNNALLRNAQLEWADFRWADLMGADLTGAKLNRADFHKADMLGAILSKADCGDTNFEDTNLRSADFSEANFSHTRMLNTDLSGAKGLESAKHNAPSNLDFETMEKSGYLASEFLRGCGLQDTAIKAALSFDKPALAESLEQEGNYYSCFISHSSKDEKFVRKLYGDLQAAGVRCWYALHDLEIGDRILDTVYGAIRKQEKLLLVLSNNSIASEWVRDEVEKGFAEERDRDTTVLFPIQLDDTVTTTKMAWAEKIQIGRHIGDLREWKSAAGYKNGLETLLKSLRRKGNKK